jgi:hypothetical protein
VRWMQLSWARLVTWTGLLSSPERLVISGRGRLGIGSRASLSRHLLPAQPGDKPHIPSRWEMEVGEAQLPWRDVSF